MKIPNAAQAHIDLDKLVLYCLSDTHPAGRHKARVFRRALGLTVADVHLLYDALLEAAATCDADRGSSDEFGDRYLVRFPLETTAGRATVISVWIIRSGEKFPRLVTCFVE